jgi:uncharacterized protein YecT (DUF1311 family)
MKYLMIILIGLIYSTGFAQTQTEMNKEENNSYVNADKELNEVYQKILSEYRSDTMFIKNLKASQRIWITFRDAELKMMYPDRESGYYGSIHPMCISSYLEQLTRERIKTLKVWLEGIEEDDACNGSVKIKYN